MTSDDGALALLKLVSGAALLWRVPADVDVMVLLLNDIISTRSAL